MIGRLYSLVIGTGLSALVTKSFALVAICYWQMQIAGNQRRMTTQHANIACSVFL